MLTQEESGEEQGGEAGREDVNLMMELKFDVCAEM
jgi:hypothetical protein